MTTVGTLVKAMVRIRLPPRLNRPWIPKVSSVLKI